MRLASTSSSVVFPAPDAPISATRRPGSATPVTEWSSVFAAPDLRETEYDSRRHTTVIGSNGSVPHPSHVSVESAGGMAIEACRLCGDSPSPEGIQWLAKPSSSASAASAAASRAVPTLVGRM